MLDVKLTIGRREAAHAEFHGDQGLVISVCDLLDQDVDTCSAITRAGADHQRVAGYFR